MSRVNELQQYENVAIAEGLAMMTYNPSIGRVLEKGGQKKFIKIMLKTINQLKEINNQVEFDTWHRSVVESIMQEIETNEGERPSYGQAQKPLNVFLKVYVDWASQPSLDKAEQLRRFLHLPLDSVVMKDIQTYFAEQWNEYVVTAYQTVRETLKKKFIDQGKEIGESFLRSWINRSDFSLNRILYEDMYFAWQECAWSIYSEKPVLLDILWSLNRKTDLV